ncbi:MAG: D-alanyl-D-alanine carboxypeptidase/D-alanyl-D-alanine-endopeptidase [Candidatus Marinimicrobia bacterium]|nr:D-alanyl-D-alanine carboxypeptidase/D-alanyl-D-alanine-endopeptidase [Candidatus Neomarinimicrobiota bacterium]
MKFKKFFIPILSISLFFYNCSSLPSETAIPVNEDMTTAQQIHQLLSNPALDQAMIGVYIEELGSGKLIYSQNEHKLLMPASNMKIFTTASAISLLGPDFTYKTRFFTDGDIIDGVLHGNLYLQGSGDPSMTARYYGDKTDSCLVLWAKKLEDLGIKKIDGNIVGDHSVFADHGIGYGWEKDDLPYYYSARTYGLSFNDNCVDMEFLPGAKIGDPVTIRQIPVENYLKLDNQMITAPADSLSEYDFYADYLSDKLVVTGQLPIDKKLLKWSAVPDPADFLLTSFRQVLKARKIEVRDIQSSGIALDYSNMVLLFTHESVPLREIIENILKISNNYYAETLLKTLDRTGVATTESAIQLEKEFLSSIGIDTDRISIADGSGLSRHNMVTTHQIVTLLKYIHNSQNREIYKDALPIGGVDGTLESRFRGSNAAGHVFAKTGYVGFVRALSGFVEAQNGKSYVFSIIANHYPVPTAMINNLQDQICTILYNQN